MELRSLDFMGYPTYKVSEAGDVYGPLRKLKQTFAGKYLKVSLSYKGQRKDIAVHRLVALAFIENPHCLPEVNHKDCDRLNNHVSNLEWCTPQENIDHAMKNNRGVGIAKRAHTKRYYEFREHIAELRKVGKERESGKN